MAELTDEQAWALLDEMRPWTFPGRKLPGQMVTPLPNLRVALEIAAQEVRGGFKPEIHSIWGGDVTITAAQFVRLAERLGLSLKRDA